MASAKIAICQHCGNEFPITIKSNPNKFCSKKCTANGRRGSIKERFWSSVKKLGPDDCWEWQGITIRGGYGRISFNKKPWMVHRLSYVFAFGDIPDGLKVCHSCDNPLCVNPKHLWLGSLLDNNRDRAKKGRSRIQNGSKNSMARLDDNKVIKIRQLYYDGVRLTELSKMFSVSMGCIVGVVEGLNWKHLPILGRPEKRGEA